MSFSWVPIFRQSNDGESIGLIHDCLKPSIFLRTCMHSCNVKMADTIFKFNLLQLFQYWSSNFSLLSSFVESPERRLRTLRQNLLSSPAKVQIDEYDSLKDIFSDSWFLFIIFRWIRFLLYRLSSEDAVAVHLNSFLSFDILSNAYLNTAPPLSHHFIQKY